MNSSDHFILTSLYMPAESWQQNFEKMRILRRELKDKYGFHVSEEMHTKHFLTDKNPYREYHWSKETKQDIILFLTVSKNKIAATPENIGVVAILTVVLNYSILFPSFTFFLDGFHLAFGDKFEICIKTTDLM